MANPRSAPRLDKGQAAFNKLLAKRTFEIYGGSFWWPTRDAAIAYGKKAGYMAKDFVPGTKMGSPGWKPDPSTWNYPMVFRGATSRGEGWAIELSPGRYGWPENLIGTYTENLRLTHKISPKTIMKGKKRAG
tara:strand:+ start:102 stop:497 length:396 start_codon:yes stop_codon:yes gene_type:complete